jgi:hypothetical protein
MRPADPRSTGMLDASDLEETRCPFCGGRVTMYDSGQWNVMCDDCELSGPLCDTQELALDWFLRVVVDGVEDGGDE